MVPITCAPMGFVPQANVGLITAASSVQKTKIWVLTVVRLGRFVESFISVRQTQKVLLVLNVKQMMSVPTLVNFVLPVVATPLLEERLVRRLLSAVLMHDVI